MSKKVLNYILAGFLIIVTLVLLFYLTVEVFPVSKEAINHSIVAQIRGIDCAIDLYVKHNSKLPDNLNELVANGYLEKNNTVDGCGNIIEYKVENNSYELRSYGVDGKKGTADDVISGSTLSDIIKNNKISKSSK